MHIAGTVILYHPESEVIENINSYLPYIDKLYVADNTENKLSKIAEELNNNDKIQILHDGINEGIAKRLNTAANLAIEDKEKLIPGNGVYAVEAELVGREISAIGEKSSHLLKGMMNIGMRPTVNGTRRTIEVNLFDFNTDIYGQTLRVFIKHYLRGEIKFTGLDELKAQLGQDKIKAIELLSKPI